MLTVAGSGAVRTRRARASARFPGRVVTTMARPATASTAVRAIASSSGTESASTSPVPPPTAFKKEKCYGIAKAGKNDCASTGNNSCGGSSKLNSDPKAWIYVPAGYCDRIVGGSLQPK